MLSGYRLMWMIVMFDLPVVAKAERKAATEFRNTLLDMGFEMSQFSVYMRFCTSGTQIETYCKRVEEVLPQGGKVNILQFTDKQYERIVSFHGKTLQPANKTPDQFDLF
ncbi:MAG: CRISPR-associated endonuclease Cas2 [Rhodoferax sp.]|jgi:CRISPR-associated protein Cas2|uniref:CRISPR-associated endonuclease Cas2 n=1 Tax=Rhodoferax sp. TaxID=50421 RepID=UPI001B63DFD1|nr:CRISPR-associated endonuclease Cas2 [Rhodoferax sp.]MBP8285934.1 CRISPR-associated endonuclease Cas2 [Rhodoferax sp.]MBP9150278.1 CRISPR-associated endonuclease Cas2 [Rhodoferax sp.]MBP9737617.1 CRISPR-associated endonuclease Cas2 [Rhodoferax sp.]